MEALEVKPVSLICRFLGGPLDGTADCTQCTVKSLFEYSVEFAKIIDKVGCTAVLLTPL
jgi:hypothetical protein